MWYFNKIEEGEEAHESLQHTETPDEEEESSVGIENTDTDGEEGEDERKEEINGEEIEEKDDSDCSWVPSESLFSDDVGEDIEEEETPPISNDSDVCGYQDHQDNYTSQTSNSSRRKKYKPGKRTPRKCPLCSRVIKYLSHHLTRQHNIRNKQERLKLLYKARARQPAIRHGAKKRKPKKCPFKGCPAQGLTRIDCHIADQHKEDRGSMMFKVMMRKANTCITAVVKPGDDTEKCEKVTDPKDILTEFEEFIYASNGGTVENKRNAANTRRQLQRVMSTMNISLEKVIMPSLPQKLLVLLRKEKKQPQTIYKYLLSVKQFVRFIEINPDLPRRLGVTMAKVNQMKGLLEHFMQSLRPSIVERINHNKAQISDLVIDGGQVKMFFDRAVKEMKQLTDPRTILTTRSSARLRNLLITNIILSQAPRSGVIENASLGEWRERKLTTIADTLEEVTMFEVKKHKTARAGPATIFLTDDIQQYMSYYVHYGRPLTGNCEGVDITGSNSSLFLGLHGRPIYKVHQEVQKTWTSLGLQGRCIPTIVRKTVATKAVRGLSKNEADNVAELMAHDPSTQMAYYVATQALQNKLNAWRSINNVMISSCGKVTSRKPSEETQEACLIKTQTEEPEEPEVPEVTASDQTRAEEPEVTASDQAEGFYSYGKATSCKTTYTPQQTTEILKHFHQYKKLDPTASLISAARYIKTQMPKLKEFKDKQLADKIRHTLHSGKYNEHIEQMKQKKRTRTLRSLTNDEITYIMRRNHDFFKSVKLGKEPCERHRDYMRGGIVRAMMPCVPYGSLSEEQTELIYGELVNKYSNNNTAFLEYISKVLLAEALEIVAMEGLGIGIDEARKILSQVID